MSCIPLDVATGRADYRSRRGRVIPNPQPSGPFRGGPPAALCLLLIPLRSVRILSHVPSFDDPALRLVDVGFVLDALDADLEPVLGPDDVLAIHAFGGALANLLGAEPDVIADVACAAEDSEDDYERENLTTLGRGQSHAS